MKKTKKKRNIVLENSLFLFTPIWSNFSPLHRHNHSAIINPKGFAQVRMRKQISVWFLKYSKPWCHWKICPIVNFRVLKLIEVYTCWLSVIQNFKKQKQNIVLSLITYWLNRKTFYCAFTVSHVARWLWMRPKLVGWSARPPWPNLL